MKDQVGNERQQVADTCATSGRKCIVISTTLHSKPPMFELSFHQPSLQVHCVGDLLTTKKYGHAQSIAYQSTGQRTNRLTRHATSGSCGPRAREHGPSVLPKVRFPAVELSTFLVSSNPDEFVRLPAGECHRHPVLIVHCHASLMHKQHADAQATRPPHG